MSRWNGRRARWRSAPATDRAGRDPGTTASRDPGSLDSGSRVLVEDHDGLLLLRLPTDDTLHTADIADLARAMRSADGDTVTIVAVAGADLPAALWPRLSESLDSLRETGTRSVRLVMSGAGHDRPDRPALARRIADAWHLETEAPDGPVLVVPGGSVFVPPGDGGWWRFAPGEEPEPLGPRAPAPDWQAAVRRAPGRTGDGCVVDQIPAGLLIRPAEATAPRPGDLFHAIPVDPRRPAVVVGVPWGEDVLATEVAEVLAALPAAVRPGVRLSPGGRRDLLPLGQSVAGLLNTEVEVTTGLPLYAADSPLGTYGVRSVLVGPDGEPRWLPFVDAVLCPPPPATGAEPGPGPGPDGGTVSRPAAAPAPRLLRWSCPLPDPRSAEDGVLLLSDAWQATVTRAGLWVDRRGRPAAPRSARAVSIEGPIIEIGSTGDRLDASLWPVLSRLLERLAPDLRARTSLHVHATPPDGGLALRTLTADHALRVIRFATAPTPRPASRVPAPVPVGAVGTVGTVGTVGVPTPRGARPERPPTPAPTGTPTPPNAPAAARALGTPDHPAGSTGPVPTATETPAPSPALEQPAPPAKPATASAAATPAPAPSSPTEPAAGQAPTPPPAPGPDPALASEPPAAPAAAPAPIPDAPRPVPVATGTSATLPPPPSRTAPAPDPALTPTPTPSTPPTSTPPTSTPTPPTPTPASGPEPPAQSRVPRNRSLPDVPVLPRHRSSADERTAFRALAEPAWERESAAVNRALAGMPALRGVEQEAARADLIALRMYLRDTPGPLDHEELTRSLRAGEDRLVPYAGCLASGLARLPSYRGAVLRGRGDADGLDRLRPGEVLRDAAPLSGRPLDPAGKDRITGAGYAVWSITGRRVRQLLDDGDEVVFAPGTAFKVLDVRTGAAGPLVLLRQLPETHSASTVLEDADETALARLDHALTGRTAPGAGDWPARCAGRVGDH